jgi:hypothetical protein
MKEMFHLRATNTQNNIKSTLKKIVNENILTHNFFFNRL